VIAAASFCVCQSVVARLGYCGEEAGQEEVKQKMSMFISLEQASSQTDNKPPTFFLRSPLLSLFVAHVASIVG
jgi:hypothetical protein